MASSIPIADQSGAKNAVRKLERRNSTNPYTFLSRLHEIREKRRLLARFSLFPDGTDRRCVTVWTPKRIVSFQVFFLGLVGVAQSW